MQNVLKEQRERFNFVVHLAQQHHNETLTVEVIDVRVIDCDNRR